MRWLVAGLIAALLGAAATLEAVNGDWTSLGLTLVLLAGLPSLSRLR